MSRPIYQIARDIVRAWPKPYFGAVPYLRALHGLEDGQSSYGYDAARSVVMYFLVNASTFRGPVAKALKAELKSAVGVK